MAGATDVAAHPAEGAAVAGEAIVRREKHGTAGEDFRLILGMEDGPAQRAVANIEAKSSRISLFDISASILSLIAKSRKS